MLQASIGRTQLIDGVLQLDLPTRDATLASAMGPSSFVVGDENALLVPPIDRLLTADDPAAAMQWFNPLVLVGPAGSGKSHIAQGLFRRLSGKLPADRAAYFTAADFGREAQAAHADRQLDAWRDRIRALQLLIVEDLHRLRPQSTVEQELRGALDAIVEAGGSVVITASREPVALTDLDPGLRDRLVAGLTVRIQRPGRPARAAMVRLAANRLGRVLSEDQVAELARRDAASPGELIGRLASLDAAGTTRDARQADGADEAALLKQIIAVTARYFAVTQTALMGPSRRASLVAARNVAVHLARQLTSLSYAQIGQQLGGRDHSTIMHAERRLAEQLPHNSAMQQAVDELDRLLRG